MHTHWCCCSCSCLSLTLGQQCTFVQITVVLRVVSLLEVYRLTLVPHLPSGDQTPAHSEYRRFTLIVIPLRLLSAAVNNHLASADVCRNAF
jgi:hypothetical protein